MRFRRPDEPQVRYTGDPEEYRLTLIEHLEELRDRVIRSFVAILIAWVLGWYLFDPAFAFLQNVANNAIRPALPKDSAYNEAFRNITDGFMLRFRLSFMIGIVFAFPYLVLQLWGFLAPALHPKEQAPFKKLAPLSVALFLLGAMFCWLIIPTALAWFAGFVFAGTQVMQEPGTLVFFILKMMLAFGAGFQLPLIVYGLGMMGLLTAETLLANWRQAATGIFIAAAVFTPSNDAFSMLMMAIPLTLLFGVSVWAVKITQGRKARTLAAEQALVLPPVEDDEEDPFAVRPERDETRA